MKFNVGKFKIIIKQSEFYTKRDAITWISDFRVVIDKTTKATAPHTTVIRKLVIY